MLRGHLSQGTVNTYLLGNGVSGALVIAGEHHYLKTEAMQLSHDCF